MSYVVDYLNCRNLNPRYFLDIIYIYPLYRVTLWKSSRTGFQVKIERTKSRIHKETFLRFDTYERALKKKGREEKVQVPKKKKERKKKVKGSRFISRQIQSATIWRTCNPCAICMIWTRRPKNFLVEFPTFKLRGGESLNRHGLPPSYYFSFLLSVLSLGTVLLSTFLFSFHLFFSFLRLALNIYESTVNSRLWEFSVTMANKDKAL